MKLSEMGAIAHELPPLAGGAPTWPIYIKPQVLEGGSLVAKEPKQVTTSQNLLLANTPTIMERWELLSIWLPAVAVYGAGKELTAAEISEIRTLLTLNIRYGGDIIWSGGSRPTIEPVAGFGGQGQIIVSENFINPLPIERGRGLTLESVVNVFSPSVLAFHVELAATLTGGALALTKPNEGTIQYLIRVLSGHRAL